VLDAIKKYVMDQVEEAAHKQPANPNSPHLKSASAVSDVEKDVSH
jgi:hypothetical protein